jgi:hypothetical protein
MTFDRFKQLWDALVTDRPCPPHNNPIVMEGCSSHTLDALVAASEGDFTVFDEIDQTLKGYDRAAAERDAKLAAGLDWPYMTDNQRANAVDVVLLLRAYPREDGV